jgi:hypothetical protein
MQDELQDMKSSGNSGGHETGLPRLTLEREMKPRMRKVQPPTLMLHVFARRKGPGPVASGPQDE